MSMNENRQPFARGESVLAPKCLHPDPEKDLYEHGVVVGPGPLPKTTWVQVWPPGGTHYYPTSSLKPFPLQENPSSQASLRRYKAEGAIVQGEPTLPEPSSEGREEQEKAQKERRSHPPHRLHLTDPLHISRERAAKLWERFKRDHPWVDPFIAELLHESREGYGE